MVKDPVIRFSGFSFTYLAQKYPTIKNLDLTIYRGEKVLVVGPSGSGKSTLGNCINGLIPFSYDGEIVGELKVDGTSVKDSSVFELSKTVGTVMQDSDAQFVALSVGEDIAFALENDLVPQGHMKRRVAEVAKLVGVDGLLKQSPQELSGGQKQRTSLAGILVDDVDVLLFDEPLANLDPQTGKYAIELIDEIHRGRRLDAGDHKRDDDRRTTIIIEHRIEDVLHREVDRILLVDDGRIVADLPPHEMVASGLLIEHGLREPLYVTALRHAGVTVTAAMRPAYLHTVDFECAQDRLNSWYDSAEDAPPPAAGDEVLTIRDLDFEYYPKRPVLSEVNFTISAGEMVSIVGTNGAGKSTLAKIICRFEEHPAGTVFFRGEDAAELTITDRASFVGFIMQNPNQMITQTQVFDEIASGLRLRKVNKNEIDERVDKVLAVCGLERFKKWPISALSYGQKKRVTIASILILDPKVIILDEPTAGQDYRHYTEIMRFLKKINDLGVTIVMITHDMHLMLEYTRRSLVIDGGRIIADTDSSDVLTSPDLVQRASLKETSLFHLAERVGIVDPKSLVDRFIQFEAVRRR
jgi:energy-coupling factor transporter ATP-binding protein EcfA2